MLELERLPGDVDPEARVLRAESRFGGTPAELVARLTEEGYEARDGIESIRAEKDCDGICDLLRDTGEPQTADEIAEALEIPQATVRKRCGALTGGRLERLGKGGKGDPYRWKILSSRANSLGEKRISGDLAPFATPEQEREIERLESLDLEYND